MRRVSGIAAVLLVLALGAQDAAAADARIAKQVFGALGTPSGGAPAAHGSYSRGCLSGAVALSETGPTWQAMRLSRNRNWGHPAMIAYLERLSRAARPLGWPRLEIGDISQPRGGPMASGHASHQIGLDADIWLRIPGKAALSRGQREEISSTSVVRPDGLGVNGNWTVAHYRLLKAAASDPAVARIFVNAVIKKALCREAPPDDRDWLRKIRAWWGHRSHFHVRLNCPEGATDCTPQTPPPPGDGCGKELSWWFTDEALHPKPPTKPKPQLTMGDLPAACRGPVLR